MSRNFCVHIVTAALLCGSAEVVLAATNPPKFVELEKASPIDVQYQVRVYTPDTNTPDTADAETLKMVKLRIYGSKPEADPIELMLGPIKKGTTEVVGIPKVNVGYPCHIELEALNSDGWKAQSVEVVYVYKKRYKVTAKVMGMDGGDIGWIDARGCGDSPVDLVNLALKKNGAIADQDSTWNWHSAEVSIDDITDGNYSHTNSRGDSWWQVKLRHLAVVDSITLWSSMGRPPNNFKVSVLQGEEERWSQTYPNMAESLRIKLPIETIGDSIKVACGCNDFLILGEVQVFGSENLKPCPDNKVDERWYPDYEDDSDGDIACNHRDRDSGAVATPKAPEAAAKP